MYANDLGLTDLYVSVLSAARASKNDLAAHFKALRAQNGWQSVLVDYDPSAAKTGRRQMDMAGETRFDRHVEGVLKAPTIDHCKAAQLKARQLRGTLSQDEQHALARHKIADFYAPQKPLSEDDIVFDDEGNIRSRVLMLECLTGNIERLRSYDANDRVHSTMDYKNHLVKRQLLGSLLEKAGIYNQQTQKFDCGVHVDKQSLQGFARAVIANRQPLDFLFGITVSQKCAADPVSQLRALLKLVGLILYKTQTQQSGGKKTRRYNVHAGQLVAMMAVVARRREVKFKADDLRYPQYAKTGLTSMI